MSVLAVKDLASDVLRPPLVRHRALWKNAGVILAGTAASQILIVLSSPLLSRIFQPEDFGAYSIYNAVFGVLGMVSALHYELAIPLPRRTSAAVQVLRHSHIVLLAFTALTVPIFWFARVPLAKAVNVEGFELYAQLLPASILIGGVSRNIGAWAMREANFAVVSRSRATQSAGQVIAQSISGTLGAGPWGLIGGQLAGQLLAVATLHRARPTAGPPNSLKRSVWAARRYADLPRYATISSFVNLTLAQLPVLLLAGLFGPVAAGLYGLAQRVLQMPAALLGQSFSQALLTSAAASNRETRHLVDVGTSLKDLMLTSVPLFAAVAIAAPELFGLVFGPKWADAGIYVRIMSPWLFTSLLAVSFSTLVTVLGRQRSELHFQMLALLVMGVGACLGCASASPTAALAWLSAFGTLVYAAKLWWVLYIARVPSEQVRSHLSTVCKRCAAPVVCMLTTYVALPGVLAGCLVILIGGAWSGGTMWRLRRDS